MKEDTDKKLSYVLLALLMLASYASFCAVMYTPALPMITSYLKVPPSSLQSSISIYLAGYAIGNLPYGPLANRFGRRQTTLLGLGLSLIGITLCWLIVYIPSLKLLNIGRFITALGATVGYKICFTYISDLYPKEAVASKVSYMMLSFAIAPGLAIALGGLLTEHFGWHSAFYGTLIYGAILSLLASKLPETLTKEKKIALNATNIFAGYLTQIRNSTLTKTATLLSIGTCYVYLFASLAPFIGMKQLGMTPQTYGFYNFLPPCGMICGFYLNRFLSKKIGSMHLLLMGIILSFFSILLLTALLNLQSSPAPLHLFLPMPFIYTGTSLVFANASSLALGSSEDKSNASAMTSFINLTICAIILQIAEALPMKPSLVLSCTFIFLSMISYLLWLRLHNHYQEKT